MKERSLLRKTLAWVLPIVGLALWALDFFMALAARAAGADDPVGLGGLVVVFCAMLLVSAVGLIVALQRPEHPIGWILSVIAFLIAVRSVTDGWVLFGPATFGPSLPGRAIVAWLSAWIWIPAIGMFGTFFFLLFPTGRLPSRRWRVVAWLAVAGIGAGVLSGALNPGPIDGYPGIANPLPLPMAFESVSSILGPGFIGLLLAIAASMVSVGVRARRAGQIERQQIKWIALAGSLFAIGFTIAVLSEEFDTIGALGVFGPIAAVAVAAGIAIQRYRLFEIDRIISRTVSYLIITAALGGLFVLVALVPTVIVGSGNAPDWLIAVATLLVFAAFRPVRRRVRSAVDRRFNRARYDAARTIERFAARLRQQTDLDSLRTELTGVVHQTMHPAHASLWIKE